ncbi:hypothetical protein NXW89_10365 [Bacteroides thetaiotaomicron]|nr:hypothetical protein [Bacteroides thetaiotaomicron]
MHYVLSISTSIWLPAWLTTYRDQRGKPRKDFRDFMELRSKNEDFRNLMTLAMPAKFWYSKFNEIPAMGSQYRRGLPSLLFTS